MRKRRLGCLALALLLSGCFGRIARYDGDEPAPLPPPPRVVATAPPRTPPPADIEQRLVGFIRWRNRRLDSGQAREIATSLLGASAQAGVDERLLACLVAVESSFDTRAVSRTGATGLGQLLPSTARELGVTDPRDVDQNLRGTATYLARMLQACEGRTDLALVSYTAGLGKVRKQLAAGKPLEPQQILFVERVMGLYSRI